MGSACGGGDREGCCRNKQTTIVKPQKGSSFRTQCWRAAAEAALTSASQRLNVRPSMSRCCDRHLSSTDPTVQAHKPNGSITARLTSRRCYSDQGKSAAVASLACPGNGSASTAFREQNAKLTDISRTPGKIFIVTEHRKSPPHERLTDRQICWALPRAQCIIDRNRLAICILNSRSGSMCVTVLPLCATVGTSATALHIFSGQGLANPETFSMSCIYRSPIV